MIKYLPANAGDTIDAIPGSGRSPGGGNGNPLQYSCLENPMDRGAWRAIDPGTTKKSDATEHAHISLCSFYLYAIFIYLCYIY